MKDCVEKLGFSSGCSDCWVSLANCTKSNCIWKCFNPSSSSCKKCAKDKCFPDLVSCSGIPENELPA